MRTENETFDFPSKRFDDAYTKTFMNGKLRITIYKQKVDENRTRYHWCIQYESPSMYRFTWNIPEDIDKIVKELWEFIDIEAAKIIYNTITDHYNDTFVGIQNERNLITEWYIGYNDVEVIRFPPFEYFEDEIRRMRRNTTTTTIFNWWTPITSIWAPITNIWTWTNDYPTYSWRLWDYELWPAVRDTRDWNYIEYISSEEYERLKANGELKSNAMYLVIN